MYQIRKQAFLEILQDCLIDNGLSEKVYLLFITIYIVTQFFKTPQWYTWCCISSIDLGVESFFQDQKTQTKSQIKILYTSFSEGYP